MLKSEKFAHKANYSSNLLNEIMKNVSHMSLLKCITESFWNILPKAFLVINLGDFLMPDNHAISGFIRSTQLMARFSP